MMERSVFLTIQAPLLMVVEERRLFSVSDSVLTTACTRFDQAAA